MPANYADGKLRQKLVDEETSGFTLRVNGEEVKVFDTQILEISINSARGELARALMQPGSTVDTYVDIMVIPVDPQGPRRLDHDEIVERRMEQDRVMSTELNGPRPMSPEFVAENTAPPGERPSDSDNTGLSEVSSSPDSSKASGGSDGKSGENKRDSQSDATPKPSVPSSSSGGNR